jgi:hypothetical protein
MNGKELPANIRQQKDYLHSLFFFLPTKFYGIGLKKKPSLIKCKERRGYPGEITWTVTLQPLQTLGAEGIRQSLKGP